MPVGGRGVTEVSDLNEAKEVVLSYIEREFTMYGHLIQERLRMEGIHISNVFVNQALRELVKEGQIIERAADSVPYYHI